MHSDQVARNCIAKLTKFQEKIRKFSPLPTELWIFFLPFLHHFYPGSDGKIFICNLSISWGPGCWRPCCKHRLLLNSCFTAHMLFLLIRSICRHSHEKFMVTHLCGNIRSQFSEISQTCLDKMSFRQNAIDIDKFSIR